MRNNEAQQPVGMPGRDDVAENRADEYAVEEQRVNRAHSEQNSSSEAIERNADVVLSVETEHEGPLLAEFEIGVARLAPRRFLRNIPIAVHFFDLLQTLGIDDAAGQRRVVLNNRPGDAQLAEEKDRGRHKEGNILPEQARVPHRQKAGELPQSSGRRAVER